MSGLPEINGVTGLTEIGRGGFGVVYRGTETEFGRDVAVKVLMPTLDERARLRFERERRAMGAVSDHHNIVTVYRGGLTDSSQPYLVMEYLRGGSLNDRLRSVGPLDWREAASIGAKLSDDVVGPGNKRTAAGAAPRKRCQRVRTHLIEGTQQEPSRPPCHDDRIRQRVATGRAGSDHSIYS